ncbi:MAG: ABC transporter permease [Anaerolineales bacterium]|nr:ABC transporter permease [Anaerolineales bacterium]MCS7248146.1 ABC transporter permease [Anaerolineales bacterium]MDW8161958.1 ABC transporter permease [Anaerolineales bacterium]MDW8447179.1 ABC transporter permease [Anaerolineales bacterium]
MNRPIRLKFFWQEYLERSFSLTIPLAAILAAFALSGLLILAWGSSPLEAYVALFSGAFGSPSAIATTLQRLTPLVFTGLAVTYGYRGGFFNIGAEGQLYMGAIAAVWVAITFPDWPSWLLVPSCILASALMGMVWVILPALLKARRGINEVLSTLLMNYIAIQYFEWVIRVDHAMRDFTPPGGLGWAFYNWLGLKDPTQPHPKSPFLVEAAHLPTLKSILETPLLQGWLGGSEWYQQLLSVTALGRISLAPFLGLFAALFIYFLMFRTVTGYRARAVGINPEAAKFMGINVPRTLFTTALVSGALAGLAGGMEVLGTQHRVIPNFLVNAGFDGIPVALIGQLNPLAVLLSATFFGALRAGANKMQVVSSVPVAVVYVIQALAIMFAIAGTTIDIGLALRKRRVAQMRREQETLEVESEAANA